MDSKRISLLDRTKETWVQPNPEVDEWHTEDFGMSGWTRAEIERVWGVVAEVIEPAAKRYTAARIGYAFWAVVTPSGSTEDTLTGPDAEGKVRALVAERNAELDEDVAAS